jgi:signal transduction histidine kinase
MERIFKVTKREKRIRNVYFIAFILLFLCYLVTVYANQELVKQSARVEHTNKLITTLDSVMTVVINAETGTRGYLLSKDSNFLEPYRGTELKANSLAKYADELSLDNPARQANLNNIRHLIDRRFKLLDYNVSNFGKYKVITDSILQIQYVGKQVMDSLRAAIGNMEHEENHILVNREEQLKNTMTAISVITLVTLALVFSLLFFGFITYMQVSRQRKKAEDGIAAYQDELNHRIQALDKANAELIKMRSLEKFAVTGRIARTIGHEVRNPLTNIMLAADQLKADMDRPERDKTYLFEMIERNCARINQQISDLLDSTKAADLNYEKTGINALVDETLTEAMDRFQLTHVRLVKKYAEKEITVAVDKNKMKIAILNLVTNALEAMEGRQNSELIIHTYIEGEKCVIKVTDNGPGMNEETLSRIFEPYFTTKKRGNGLGMTNTQNIILNHKGDITVESAPGLGTSFKIALKLEKR